jgi:hypothetical protein
VDGLAGLDDPALTGLGLADLLGVDAGPLPHPGLGQPPGAVQVQLPVMLQHPHLAGQGSYLGVWDAPGRTRTCNLRIRSETAPIRLVPPWSIAAGRVEPAVRLVASPAIPVTTTGLPNGIASLTTGHNNRAERTRAVTDVSSVGTSSSRPPVMASGRPCWRLGRSWFGQSRSWQLGSGTRAPGPGALGRHRAGRW